MVYKYQTRCACGDVALSLTIPKSLNTYIPRACDCSFCMERGAAYLSDPLGSLVIKSTATLNSLKQGSEQAKFLSCQKCGTLIGAVCTINGVLKGAVNAVLFCGDEQPKDPVVASPRLLSAEEKVIRWDKIWLKIIINNVN